MTWDLGSMGLLYLGGMSIGFGLLAQLLSWRAGPKWLWAMVAGCSFGVGLFVSEVLFGWATEEDLQPNIDGLSRDEVLLIGLVPVAVSVVVARRLAKRRGRVGADEQGSGHDHRRERQERSHPGRERDPEQASEREHSASG